MPVPFYLSAEPDPVFALYHPSSTRHSLDTAVLLCPPFGWEDMCSYRSRREWAQRLADDGHPTLRIDLPGSGDSGGSPRDPDRLGAWDAAVTTAALWLRSLTGIRRVAAIGIGLGGVVALHAARSGAEIDELALWGVPARGRRLVRELRAFSQMESSQLDGGVDGLPDGSPDSAHISPAEQDGGLAIAGYLLSAETVAALEELDLSDGELGASLARVLLLERDGRDADPRLRSSLEGSGAEVSLAPGEGYARMMMAEPQDAVPARAVFDDVGNWLARGAAAASGGEQVAFAPPSVRLDSIELELPDGTLVQETPLSFEHSFGDPFGILSEPVKESSASLCAVWLNAGPQRRTGPNRMWVELARRWAGRGVPCLRLDLAGIGDAGGDGGPLVDPRSFFVPDYIEQVGLVLQALQERGWPPRFIVGGLCSGGYWAFQMALEDERVQSALMLNPGILVYDAGVSHAVRSALELRGKFLELSTWRRLLRGDLTMTAHLRTARVLLAHLPQRIWRALSRLVRERLGGDEGEGRDEVDEVFDRLRAKGARASMIFAGEEHVHIDLQRHGHLDRLDRWPSITVEHIAAPLDLHTMRPLWLQRTVHDLLDRTIQGELTQLEVNRGA
jgi:alpha-beta hydrolase superfamily lysophospholipase